MKGRVKWFNNKGYGFITTDEKGDIFVHHKDISGKGFRSLTKGLRVEFELDTQHGRAINVRPLGLIYIGAGTCYTRTGERRYVPISFRQLVGTVNRGYKTECGNRAWVPPNTPLACATWGGWGIDIGFKKADKTSCSTLEFRQACGPGEFDAALKWLHQGKEWGRGSSFWPVPQCPKCEGQGHWYHTIETNPAPGECLRCGGSLIWAFEHY
jgi:CspA family cold shock protein